LGVLVKIASLLRTKGQFVATVSPETTVAAVVDDLGTYGIGALLVSSDGVAIAGIVSERDVVRALKARGTTALHMTVAEIMTVEVATCSPETDVDELMRTMTDRRIRHVPVVVGDELVGIVSIGDVVKHRIGELERENQAMADYVSGR
jgi:CBS domain-containing protein